MTSTVPREFVHRAAIAEVFLTGWDRIGEDRFTATAQWPRAHSFFTPVDGCHDPLLAAETIRQVGTLLAHAAYDVPLGHQFLMWELSYDIVPGRNAVGGTPADLELDVVCADVRRRGRRLAGMRIEVTIRSAGRVIASGSGSFDCTSPAVYRRVRGERVGATGPRTLPPALAPAAVGRFLDTDVVLSPTGDSRVWQLRAFEQHPVLFDHPVDHAPGMVLIEAARQAARALHPAPAEPFLPTRMRSEFSRYAELDTPCWISAEEVTVAGSTERSVRVTGHQDGNLVFSCVLGSPGAGR
ncbi:ScbA/BarX family gamma-butyrolactone biosynthesis protein [Streptomyces yaizuensis]|uniref:Gamma-butyrolactone biosynthesis protein SrrX n=1 Tax=Streptomyces yaizuensis TaxID=2989713 RepID=A0ABQ5PAF5_9ACTN|nr:ScbA/BarX family gamma-butyrolactone biosynthesis protein [Streptomyces sp. YSPA8]GLF99569.1 gamma-butyrolactone biosynthesis protein SrrX [Streptomyces sp. YSPA8]